MLEKPHERVELLKAGVSGKEIEELYILLNDIKIVGNSGHIGRMNLSRNNFKKQ